MYTVGQYGRMIADDVRMNAYTEALRTAIEPDCVVLDIGTGSGIMAVLAAQLGARQVYALEPSNTVLLAESIAKANGLDECIQFYRALSTDVDLPEPVDVIVSDLRGTLPLYGSHIPSLIDARKRFLKDDGILIPQQDILWMAPITAEDAYAYECGIWHQGFSDINLQAGIPLTANAIIPCSIQPKQLLSSPQSWGTIDFLTVADPDFTASCLFKIEGNAIGHGIGAWFSTELVNGIGFTTEPSHSNSVYNRALFPWPKPVPLEKNDEVEITISAKLIGDSYTWLWNTTISPQRKSKAIKAGFKQSTFQSKLLSLHDLHKQHAKHLPLLNEQGLVLQAILNQFDGSIPLEAVASSLMATFPGHFKSYSEALGYVGKIAQKYS